MFERLLPLGFWVVAALGLDFLGWFVLGPVSVLADNPGLGSALVLCWAHAFVLPACAARPWLGWLRLGLAVSVGFVKAVVALVIGLIAGLQIGSMALVIGLAASGPYTGQYNGPPGPVLGTLQDVAGAVMVWSGPAAGSAVALATAVGLGALWPGAPRPRLSWKLVASGAWASIVFLPDYSVFSLDQPWREPVILIAAGLPSLVIMLSRGWIKPHQAV